MYGVIGFFMALTAITVTQVDSQLAGVFNQVDPLGLEEVARIQLGIIRARQQHITNPPTVSPDVSTDVWVKRAAYVELQCPLEGSSVVWTVISGQSDGIRFGRMLIFPRMMGNFRQLYQCRVLDRVASVKVHVVAEIPSNTPDTAKDVCEHGRVCLLTCADQAKWDGVRTIGEVWTQLPWSNAAQVGCFCT